MALNWSIAVLIAFIHVCVGTPWATPAQEALDEIHDAEIFRAVLSSMEQWQKKQNSSHHRRKRADSQVCYEGLGCYQDSGPFGYLDMLPATPEDVGTRFLLYASHTPTETAVDVPFANISQVWAWAEDTFNKSQPTKVIVHGFGSDCDHVWVYEMKSALMAVEPCNVICVDWGNGAAVPNYVKASANTRLVGKQVALLLSGLQSRGLDLTTTHVIGFSLGAHVAGFAGAQLSNLSRITGLDPAGPLFESQDPRARLDSSDAMFVDVIHSNGENLILGGLGSWQPMGHVDFYPNGGRMQKGCSNLFVGAVTDILWSATEVEGRSLCNHRRAYKFFTDSLSPRCHFPAFPCESYDKFLEGSCFPCAGDKRCGNMGYYADKSTVRGTLFLITRDEEPFCAHQYHVRVESAPSDTPAVSYGKMQITLVGSADINETFTLTSKDDAEIRVGVPLTRIAVPHPALLEPRSVQLTYTAYSGWLSSGLAKWGVDKLTLTDSFGKSMSVCKKGLKLDSGVPVTLPLYPGECNPPRDANATETPPSNQTSLSSSILDIFRYKPTPVVQIGDEVIPDNPSSVVIPHSLDSHLTTLNPSKQVKVELTTSNPLLNKVNMKDNVPLGSVSIVDIAGDLAAGLLENKPWRPVDYVVDGSSSNSLLDKDVREDSRAFADDSGSVALRNKTSANVSTVEVGANFRVGNTSGGYQMVDEKTLKELSTQRPEIKEPVLVTTTNKDSLIWSDDGDSSSSFRPRAISLIKIHQSVEVSTRREIKEPILNPTTPKSKLVKTRQIETGNYGNEWVPKQDLKPPALGANWQHWNRKDDQFDEWQRGGSVAKWGEFGQDVVPTRDVHASPRVDVATAENAKGTKDVSNDVLTNVDVGDANRTNYNHTNVDTNKVDRLNIERTNVNATKNNRTKNNRTTVEGTKVEKNTRNGKQITVQLFPKRLAAILSQAERFARQQFLPRQTTNFIDSQNSRKLDDNDDASPAQRRPKYYASSSILTPAQIIRNMFNFNRNFTKDNNQNTSPVRVIDKTDAIKRSDSISYDTKSATNSETRDKRRRRILVPYTYHVGNRNTPKYIPLSNRDDSRGSEHER